MEPLEATTRIGGHDERHLRGQENRYTGYLYFRNGDHELRSTYGWDLINGVRCLDLELDAKESEVESRA